MYFLLFILHSLKRFEKETAVSRETRISIQFPLTKTQVLLEARSVVGLEVNTQKTGYMVMSRHHNAAQNHTLMTANGYKGLFLRG
jgi:hypothetical protein